MATHVEAERAAAGPASERASATVEYTGLILLLVAAFTLAIAFGLLSGGAGPGRELGNRIAERIACGPRVPGACRHHPAVEAYGWPLSRVLRYMTPLPRTRTNAGGTALVPVDFRYCRQARCAVPRPGAGGLRLTASNRRVTVFTEVDDRRASGGAVGLTWWFYRPTIGWEALRRTVGAAEIEAAAGTRVLLDDTPMLVPLETLDGRNHVRFPVSEQPPWQWRVGSVHGPRGR